MVRVIKNHKINAAYVMSDGHIMKEVTEEAIIKNIGIVENTWKYYIKGYA